MITAGSTVMKCLNVKSHSRILHLVSSNVYRTSCKFPFSTTSQCVSQSAEKEFVLRHQTSPEKKTNSNWVVYRIASLGLLGGLAGCFLAPGNIIVDFATVTLLVHHNYFGLKSVIADYAPLFLKDWFIKMLYFFWFLVSVMTLGLLYSFNYNNIGFSKALVNFFKL